MRRFWLKLLRRRKLQADLDAELALHRQLAAEGDNSIDLGNTALIREEALDLWRFTLMEDLARDVWYAARWLRRTPIFTAAALATLVLGIGVNTAIFSLVDTVLLRTLPVVDPGGLEQITISDGAREQAAFSYPMFHELRSSAVFSTVFARDVTPVSLVSGDRTERGVLELVSGNYFSALGVRPFVGRTFTDDDDAAPLSHPVAVLGYRYWKDHLSGDAALIGKTIRIDNQTFTVVGVAAPEFFGVELGTMPDVWVPLAMQPVVLGSGRRSFDQPMWSFLTLFVRRKVGVSAARASAVASATAQHFYESASPHGAAIPKVLLRVKPASHGLSRVRATYGNALYILLAAAGTLLLAACANIAGLLLARSAARRREIAMRRALGAGRMRLIRQHLVESLILGLGGGIIGLCLAPWAVRALLLFLPTGRLPLAIDTHLDGRLLLFGIAVTLGASFLFGVVPAIQAAKSDLAEALKERDLGAQGPRRALVRSALVTVQVALSMLLLSAAGLFSESLRNSDAIQLGFKTGNVVTATVNPALSGYTQPQLANFYQRLERRLHETPGILAAGMSETALLGGSSDEMHVNIPGQAVEHSLVVDKVSADFFRAAGISIVDGRGFLPTDTPHSTPVAILSRTAAVRLFRSGSAIGRKVIVGGQAAVEVAGVSGDSKYRSVREDVPPMMFLSFAQERDPSRERTIYALTSVGALRALDAVKSAIREFDTHLPIYNLKSFDQQKAESLSRERMVAALSEFFATLALLLAAVGLYGVMAQLVAHRNREIGIRMSLGADRDSVVWMVLREALAMVGAGVVVGLFFSHALGAAVRAELYGVNPHDPVTLGTGAAVEAVVAILAAGIPAWNAARVDPAVVLRSE